MLLHEGNVLRQGTPLQVCADERAMEQANLEPPAVMRLYRWLVQRGILSPGEGPPKPTGELGRRR